MLVEGLSSSEMSYHAVNAAPVMSLSFVFAIVLIR